MKTIVTLAAIALLGTAVPALAQETSNSQGEALSTQQAVHDPVPGATTPRLGHSLNGISDITVLAVPDKTGLILDQGPVSNLNGNARVAEAITKAGYTGSEILGYDVDGASLTVYV